MKLPKTDKPEKYVDLYIIDFGDQCAMGYTAEEVATLFESQKFADAKAFRIHNARPDGTMELAGVPREKFALESGMFFHCLTEKTAHKDFEYISQWAQKNNPPCLTKLHLAKLENGTRIIALIYPAEYEQQLGNWLSDSEFQGQGAVDAGVSQVAKYYDNASDRIKEKQLFPEKSALGRSFDELLRCVGLELQR